MDILRLLKEPVKVLVSRFPFALTENEKTDRLTNKVIGRVCKPGDTCVDAGSHKGRILEMMLHASPGGMHYAFEPIPALFDLLEKKYRGKALILPFALSNAAGAASFNLVLTNMAYSGLLKRKYDRPERDIQIEVQTARLDDMIPAHRQIRLIKLDLEGGEYRALQGSIGLLTRWKPVILFEFGKASAGAYGNDASQLWELLTILLPYRIYTLPAWLCGREPLSKQHFCNCFENGNVFFFVAIA